MRARPPAEMPPLDVSAYTCVTKADELQDWVARAVRSGVVAVDTETDGLDAMQCRLVGISLAVAPGEACYVPLAHGAGDGLDLGAETPEQLDEETALALLAPDAGRCVGFESFAKRQI